ncbi:DUF4384 domain-containing protein [Azospirillum agricola]|uniref:DUF4384 domain-containing protein n=1 Tax=Azospirillum agricola TaxID=1720247 RepID=UPI000A0F1508|nr:DUF4384 domain-containing protein [Azospirillum agricola]SMH45384.1 protein of unknown function [Azospirillum lipoferum]
MAVEGMVGRRLGKYEWLDAIRREDGDTLYRAVDPDNGRTVTLRCVPLSRFAGRDAALERFRRDARAATRLIHPHIAAIQASGEIDGMAYVALPPEEGRRLDERLSGSSPLPWSEALATLGALLDALARAHHGGVVHGALDATVIRLGTGGGLVVAGFGLAALHRPDATESDDLRDAGLLAETLLAGQDSRPGVAALLARIHGDGSGFTDAASFREAVRALASPPDAPRPRHGLKLAAVLLVGLGVAGAFAWQQRFLLPLPDAATAPPPAEAPSPLAKTTTAETTTAETTPAETPPADPPPSPPEPGTAPEPAAPPPASSSLPEEPPEEPSAPPPEPSDSPPPPDSPPPAPREPARPPVAAVRAALEPLPCALLAVEEVQGRLLISGTVAGEAALPAISEALGRAASGWDHGLDVAVARPGLCGPLTLLAPAVAANAALEAPLSMGIAGGGTLHGGDPLILDIGGPAAASRLQVDYFTSDGNVVHLLPNPLEPDGQLDAGAERRLGERGAGGRFWSIGAPFGQELVVALATPSPLFAAPRPEVEPAVVYLADLKRALAAAGPDAAPLAVLRFIATAP